MEALLVRTRDEMSPQVLGFLNEQFKTHTDLSRVSSISTDLKKECGDLDRNLVNLQKNLSSLVSAWVSRSNSIKICLNQLNLKVQNFGSYPSQDGIEKENVTRVRKILEEDLPTLAKEVRRIEDVRSYAETTLRLEALVGDLEDATLSIMNQNTRNTFSVNVPKMSSSTDIRWKIEKLLIAVKSMNAIEDVVTSFSNFRPQWHRLLKSVDARVDKGMATLRLQALADHRALVASVGWPPPLTISASERNEGSKLTNPLVLLQGEKKESYAQSFLALVSLQYLQFRREERQHNISGHRRDHELELWAIDELVIPIASRFEHHFSKWFDEPKFIFALVYKITRDYSGGIDDVLQPLIDKARLVGYSAKEAWVSAMARTLSDYLAKRVFPVLFERYSKKDGKAEVTSQWLHSIDLIISFDKKMHALASLGTPLTVDQPVQLERIPRGMSVLSLFCDRLDWLRFWAKIELKDARTKLNAELDDARAWVVNNNRGPESCIEGKPEPFLLSTKEDHKAPFIAESTVNITRAIIERCYTIPSIKLQSLFIRQSAAKLLWRFFNILLRRFEEAEFKAGEAEDDSLTRLSGLINAARYCETILREWSEEVNFLEMRNFEADFTTHAKTDLDDPSCFFWEEIQCLMKLETDWLAEIMAALLQNFETHSWEYVRNKEQWGRVQGGFGSNNSLGSGDLALSPELVQALDPLRSRLQMLDASLNSKDFLDLWRSVADGLDQFLFGSIVMTDARFSNHGFEQFSTDMKAVFSVFHPFCARPEAFFPCTRDSLKLLQMSLEDTKQLQSRLSTGGNKMECLQARGIAHVTPSQAEKILKNRSFSV